MLTLNRTLNDTDTGISWLSNWGIDPAGYKITSGFSEGYGTITLRSSERTLLLRYTLESPQNLRSLEQELDFVTKWKYKGAGAASESGAGTTAAGTNSAGAPAAGSSDAGEASEGAGAGSAAVTTAAVTNSAGAGAGSAASAFRLPDYLPAQDGKSYIASDGYLAVLLDIPDLPSLSDLAKKKDPSALPYHALGKALGDLHAISSGSSCLTSEEIKSHFSSIKEKIEDGGGDSRAENEADFLCRILTSVPARPGTTGTILGRPSLTNILYDEANQIFFFTSLENTHGSFLAQDLASIQKSILAADPDAEHTKMVNDFLSGYRESQDFPVEEEELLELFARVRNLEEYADLLYITSESSDNETPDQLMERCRFFSRMSEISADFGGSVMGFAPKGDDMPDFELLKQSIPTYYTSGLFATAKWYEDVLRFSIHYDQDVEGRNIVLASRDAIRMIFVESKNGRAHTARELYGDGLDGYFTTEEPEILQAEMIAEGVTIVRELSKTDFTERTFVFEDIDDRRFEVRYASHDGT